MEPQTMEKLIQTLSKKIRISSDLESAIGDAFQFESHTKGNLLLREGAYCHKLYFMEKGTVRTFYHHNGKDATSWFYKEGDFFTSWYSFYTQKPGFESIELLEDSVILSIEYTTYQRLMDQNPTFERFGRILAEEQTAYIDQYSKGYMFLSAVERYKLILEIFPDIELRVKLGHLASFLGISQETLSRIRSGK